MSKAELRNLPEGWRWVRLGDVITEAQPGFACGERDPNGLIQLRMNNVDTRGNVVWNEFIRVPFDKNKIEKYELIDGDVLFNNTNSVELVGKSALFLGHMEPVVYSNHFTRIRVDHCKIFAAYLTTWLIHLWNSKTFERICNRWIGQSAVKNEKLLSLSIPLPPLPQQKRIAAILNEQMAAVEKARAAAEVQVEAAKALLRAQARKIFESPESRSWTVKKLGEILAVKSGDFLPSKAMNTEGSYPVYGGNGINGHHDSFMFEDSKIVIGRVGAHCGCVNFTQPKAWITDNALYISEKKVPFDDVYMSSYLIYLNLNNLSNSMAQPLISGKLLYPIIVRLPQISEQQRIAAILTEQMAETKKLRKSVDKQLNTIKSLPASLLRQAFSGEL